MVAINKLAHQIIQAYDRNNDGHIQLGRGNKDESFRYDRQYLSFPDRDEVILSKVSRQKLFQAADTNGDKKITQAELTALLSTFDTNNDGKLKNKGPFWNRKGEYKNYQKAFPGRSQIIDRNVIYKPQPPYHPGPPLPQFPRALGGTTVGIRLA